MTDIEALFKRYFISIKYYQTKMGLHNYFIFINTTVAGKGSIPQFTTTQARTLAIAHAELIIKEYLLTSN